jgi:hypothetical protein
MEATDHADHLQGHEQDETHVLNGPLSPLACGACSDRAKALMRGGVQLADRCIEHRSLLDLVAPMLARGDSSIQT